MEQKQRLFIYDRREVSILVLLGLMVAAFAFTLGVHLGKKITIHPLTPATAEVPQTATLQDSLPNKQELTEQSRGVQAAADEELSRSLHQEVERTGIKLKTVRQVELPSQTKAKSGGATSLKTTEALAAPEHVNPKKAVQELTKAAEQLKAAEKDNLQVKEEEPASSKPAKFTLQIGSFPSAEEAKSKMDELRTQGLRPFVRSVQVKGLGKRFRLFVGDFTSRNDAEKAGRKYQSEHMIDSYLISRSGD